MFKAITPKQRPRVSDIVAGQIEELIVEGKLTPGSALPPERELAAQMQVSRPSLREALLKLEAHGFLHLRRGGGYEVSAVTAPTITEPLVHLMGKSLKARQDVLELRRGLESMAAALAAQRATGEDIERIEEAYRAIERAERERGVDSPEGHQVDVRFHLAIADASHNLALAHLSRGILELVSASVQRAREEISRQPAGLEELGRQHRSIVEAIRARDPELASKAALDHLKYVQAHFRSASDADGKIKGRKARKH